jgi:hypothetical protein
LISNTKYGLVLKQFKLKCQALLGAGNEAQDLTAFFGGSGLGFFIGKIYWQ